MMKLIRTAAAASILTFAGCMTPNAGYDNNNITQSCNDFSYRRHDPQAEVNARANDNILGGALLFMLGGGPNSGTPAGNFAQSLGNAQMRSGVAMQEGQVHAGQAWTEKINWSYHPLSSPTYDCITLDEPGPKPGNSVTYMQDLVYPTRAVNLANLRKTGTDRIFFLGNFVGCQGKTVQFGLLRPGASEYSYFVNGIEIDSPCQLRWATLRLNTLLSNGLVGPIEVHWNIVNPNGTKYRAVSYNALICND
jgi:hypothetical protein